MKLRSMAIAALSALAFTGISSLTASSQVVGNQKREFTFDGYCNAITVRITNGVVHALNWQCVDYTLGGVVVSGGSSNPNGTIVIQGHPPDHNPGVNHLIYIFPDRTWKIYHVTAIDYFLANSGTWTERTPRR